MRVLVCSDTHVTNAGQLPRALLELAGGADHIIHAGDLIVREVVDVLRAFAPVTAVCGNVDDAEVAALLPHSTEVEVDGVRFGVVHDGGQRAARHERLQSMFPTCDVVVYGHSHLPETAQLENGAWVINPGSAVQRRRAPFHSVVWLETAAGAVASVELVDIDVL